MRLGLRIDLGSRETGFIAPELRGNAVTGMIGTATPASYSTTTGDGSVTRVDISNQSFVGWTGLDNAKTYTITFSCTSGSSLTLKSGSATGATSKGLLPGESATHTLSPTLGQITLVSGSGTVGLNVASLKATS